MKKKFVCVAATMVLSAGMAFSQGDSVEGFAWSDLGLVRDPPAQTRLFDFGGSDITFDIIGEPSYLYQFVVDVGSDTGFGAMETAGRDGIGWAIGSEHESSSDYAANDDVVIAEANWIAPNDSVAALQEQFTDISDAFWGSRYYFRWFNSPTMASATEAGFIHNDNWVFPSTGESTAWIDGSLNTFLTYPDGSADLAGNEGSEMTGQGWQSMPMVPEPGSFALFGLGLLTVAARRKLRKTA